MKTASATAAAITGTVAALSDRELLAQTGNLARVERHLQGAIIDHLAEIEARSLFLRRGFASLFEYAVRELGYSDAAAGRRIAAMRLCADSPQTRERLRDGSLSLSAAAELQWAFDRQRRRVPPVAATATRRADTPRADTPQAATTPAVAALPTEPPLVLDAVGRQKLVEEAAGKSTRQVKRMLADLDPELAAAADRVRPLGNGRYELKALIDAECQRGLEQLTGLLSHVDRVGCLVKPCRGSRLGDCGQIAYPAASHVWPFRRAFPYNVAMDHAVDADPAKFDFKTSTAEVTHTPAQQPPSRRNRLRPILWAALGYVAKTVGDEVLGRIVDGIGKLLGLLTVSRRRRKHMPRLDEPVSIAQPAR